MYRLVSFTPPELRNCSMRGIGKQTIAYPLSCLFGHRHFLRQRSNHAQQFVALVVCLKLCHKGKSRAKKVMLKLEVAVRQASLSGMQAFSRGLIAAGGPPFDTCRGSLRYRLAGNLGKISYVLERVN